MRIKNICKFWLNNLCIICSASLLIIQVLDWYNPFMDFMGHSLFLLYLLCGSALLLGVENLPGESAQRKRRRRRGMGKVQKRESLRKV